MSFLKTYLMTPGPTPIPEKIHATFAEPLIHHRTPAFETLMGEVRARLKTVFGTRQEVLLLASTGTGAMDAAITNLFSPGDAVLTINGGKFGERWTKLAKTYGLSPTEIKLEPGAPLSLSVVTAALDANPAIRAILFQASETSTGTQMPVEGLCKLARERNLLSVCDAITACGVSPLPMDAWGIDVLLSGSQKAFMIPPGVAFIALSEKAWEYSKSAKLPRFYFDLAREHKAHLKNQTAWTPAISLIQGLHRALEMMTSEGLEALYARHALLAECTRRGVAALGLEVLAHASPSSSVTAVKVPALIADGKKIPKLMRDRYGVVITGGQDELEGKIFRLSHFGYVGIFDITTTLAALELTLLDLGVNVKLGSAVGAALSTYREGAKW